jgi:hypothetical protein
MLEAVLGDKGDAARQLKDSLQRVHVVHIVRRRLDLGPAISNFPIPISNIHTWGREGGKEAYLSGHGLAAIVRQGRHNFRGQIEKLIAHRHARVAGPAARAGRDLAAAGSSSVLAGAFPCGVSLPLSTHTW